jgi:hypothetical protein
MVSYVYIRIFGIIWNIELDGKKASLEGAHETQSYGVTAK